MSISGKRVLVVDDDSSVSDLLKDTLTAAGADVTVAATMKEGLRALQTGRYALILLDYVIREKVAEQFLAEAAAHDSSAAIPVFIVSGHGSNLSMDRFSSYPQVKAVLSKPFEPGLLLNLVEKVV